MTGPNPATAVPAAFMVSYAKAAECLGEPLVFPEMSEPLPLLYSFVGEHQKIESQFSPTLVGDEIRGGPYIEATRCKLRDVYEGVVSGATIGRSQKYQRDLQSVQKYEEAIGLLLRGKIPDAQRCLGDAASAAREDPLFGAICAELSVALYLNAQGSSRDDKQAVNLFNLAADLYLRSLSLLDGASGSAVDDVNLISKRGFWNALRSYKRESHTFKQGLWEPTIIHDYTKIISFLRILEKKENALINYVRLGELILRSGVLLRGNWLTIAEAMDVAASHVEGSQKSSEHNFRNLAQMARQYAESAGTN